MSQYSSCDPCHVCEKELDKCVNIPIQLYESMKGKYFMGYAQNVAFGNGKKAWVRLYNPCDSNMTLYVNVWSITVDTAAPYLANFWFNAKTTAVPTTVTTVTPTNTAICSKPKVLLQYAANVTETPTCGTLAFSRTATGGTTIMEEENGKLIFPPGGSLLIELSLINCPTTPATAKVAFGWWEEKIPHSCAPCYYFK